MYGGENVQSLPNQVINGDYMIKAGFLNWWVRKENIDTMEKVEKLGVVR